MFSETLRDEGRKPDRVLDMVTGAVRELRIGDPRELPTHVGPVIDDDARSVMVDGHGHRTNW